MSGAYVSSVLDRGVFNGLMAKVFAYKMAEAHRDDALLRHKGRENVCLVECAGIIVQGFLIQSTASSPEVLKKRGSRLWDAIIP